MAGLKKLGISITVILVLFALTLTALASDTETVVYTGSVEELTALIDNYYLERTVSKQKLALNRALEYSFTVDPGSEGYTDALLRLDTAELDLASTELSQVKSGKSAAQMNEALDSLEEYLKCHTLLDTTAGVSEFRSDYRTAKVMIALAYLDECKSAEDAEIKHGILDSLERFITSYPLDFNDSFQADFELECFKVARLYFEEVKKDNSGVAQLGAKIRRLNAFLKKYPVSIGLSGARDFYLEYAAVSEAYYRAYEAQKYSTMSEAHAKDFLSNPIVSLTFDTEGVGSLVPQLNVNSEGEVLTYIGEDCACGFSRNPIEDGEHAEWCANKYYTVRYDKEDIHFRTYAGASGITDSVVFEFKITTFDKLPDNNIWFEDSGAAEGISWSVNYLNISPNGDILDYTAKKVLVENAVTPGEWTHIAIAVDYLTNEVKLYVDYELVNTRICTNATYGYYYTPQYLRIGTKAVTAGSSFSLDDVRVYSGYAPREMDYYSSLTAEEKFVFCVSQLANEKLGGEAKMQYYDLACGMVDSYLEDGEYTFDITDGANAQLKGATDAFVAFDKGVISDSRSADNYSHLKLLYGKLCQVERNENTVALRSYWIKMFNNFYDQRGDAITVNGQNTEEYEKILKGVADIRDDIAIDTASLEFAETVKSFYIASVYEKKLELYEQAQEQFSNLNMNSYTGEGIEEKFPTLFSAIEDYYAIEDTLYEFEVLENAERLSACLYYISAYDTPLLWEQNYDMLEYYVTYARKIIEEDKYDKYYIGLSELIESFKPMNEYFFGKMQEAHVAYISSELEKYEKSTLYTEKYCILRAIEMYVEANDVDRQMPVLSALLQRTENELLKLGTSLDGHNAYLAECTRLFIESCEGLKGNKDYPDIKEAYTEASVYLYSLDVREDSLKDALAIYRLREAQINAIEAYAEQFIKEVLLLGQSNNQLESIIKCSEYLDKLVPEAPGVDAAQQMYSEAIESYNMGIETVNRENLLIRQYAAAVQNTAQHGSLTTLSLIALREQ